MILSPEDGKLYYKLWFPLLEYVNEKKKVYDLKNIATTEELDPAKIKEVANVLWNVPNVIDGYLAKEALAEMAPDDREIISDNIRLETMRTRTIFNRETPKEGNNLYLHGYEGSILGSRNNIQLGGNVLRSDDAIDGKSNS